MTRMRRTIFKNDDQFLTVVLNTIDRLAHQESFAVQGWGEYPTSVDDWVRANLPAPE
jgi:hypothetical protein